jgi:hypothetical protein
LQRFSPARACSSRPRDQGRPWAVWGERAKQFFFSDRVDMRSFVYQPIYETPPYNLLALK